MKKDFYIDIWELININNVNHILDEQLSDKEINAVDINYKCKTIDENGSLLIEADFEVVDNDGLPVGEP